MAFSPFEFDVEVHSKMGDDPNVDNDMTADDLKAMFDSPMVAFKEWINGILIPALNVFVPEDSIAVFIQSEKPGYTPCFWFKPAYGGTYDMIYVDINGNQTEIKQSITVDSANIAYGAVTRDKIADGAVTPDKLDRGYFENDKNIILKEGTHYGNALPPAGQPGRLFFKKVT